MSLSRVPISLVIAATLAMGLPSRLAGATSTATARPHDPTLGCYAILRLVENLSAGRVRDGVPLFFYTDALGRVDPDEEAALLHAMRNNEGRPDDGPIRLDRAYLIHSDRVSPVYLVVLERQVWRENRYEQDGMGIDVPVRDPRHYPETSYWLASFLSNRIMHFRETRELSQLTNDVEGFAGCAPGWLPELVQ